MIRKVTLAKLYPIVEKAICQAFDLAIQKQKNPGDFLLFLENAHISDVHFSGLSKYVVGVGSAGIHDSDRNRFVDFYMRRPFEAEFDAASAIDDKRKIRELSIHFELMIYSHAWESYPNLRILKQLANLCSGNSYDWEIAIPPMGRSDFIRKEIRDKLKKRKLDLSDIMTQAYHSQLRNAFAHSQYSFYSIGGIHLENYSGKPYELKEILFDEWEKRITLTVLLFNILNKIKIDYKRKLGMSSEYSAVWVPNKHGFTLKYLVFDDVYNVFSWKR
jgi:hypothetical protein